MRVRTRKPRRTVDAIREIKVQRRGLDGEGSRSPPLCWSIWNSRRLSCGSMASHATLSCYLCWCWTAVPAEACELGLWHLLSALSLSALWLIRRVSLSFRLSTESFDTFKLAFRVIAHTQTHDNVKYLACHICVQKKKREISLKTMFWFDHIICWQGTGFGIGSTQFIYV